MNHLVRHSKNHFVGPGGIKCPCCTLGVPSVTKRFTNRRIRRLTKKALRSEA